jgi:hypothetical protein
VVARYGYFPEVANFPTRCGPSELDYLLLRSAKTVPNDEKTAPEAEKSGGEMFQKNVIIFLEK